jgi:hypothetical protein
MGWKETNVNEQVGKDGGPIETKVAQTRDARALDEKRGLLGSPEKASYSGATAPERFRTTRSTKGRARVRRKVRSA